MSFFIRAKQILLGTNKEFWDHVRRERGLTQPVLYLGVFLLWLYWLLSIFGLYMYNSGSSESVERYVTSAAKLGLSPTAGILLLGLFIALLFFVGSFFYTALLHATAKLFRGSGSYAQTYRAYVYGATPYLLFFPIPVLSTLGSLYSTYLVARGVGELHGFSLMKGFLVGFLAGLFLMLLFGGFFIGLIFILSQMPGVHFS